MRFQRIFPSNQPRSLSNESQTTIGLPTTWSSGTKISVRPSGTEPKIKFYIEVKGEMGCPKCYASANAEAEKKVEAVRKSLGI